MSVSPRSVATGLRLAAIPYAMGGDRLGCVRRVRGVGRIGVAAAAGAFVASCPARAFAQDGEPVRLVYDAPAGCPSESDFRDMVARDGGRLEASSYGSPTRSVVVHIESSGSVVGTLVVGTGDGTDAAREIQGERCEDVARSLAVLVALVAEPPLPAPPAKAAPVEPHPAVPETRAPQPPAPRAPVGVLAVPVDETQPEPPEFEAPVESPTPHRWRLGISGELTVSTGASPDPTPAFAAYVELVDLSTAAFAPSVRVGVELAADGTVTNGAVVHRIVGRLDACPWQAALSRPWSDDAFTLQACARIDVGRLELDPLDFGPMPVARAADVLRPWIAPAGLLRLGWRSPSFFFAVEGGAVVPLVRERFSFPSTRVPPTTPFEIPPLAMTTGLGFGGFFL